MLKVSSIVPRNIKRYALKSTCNAKYNRTTDLAFLCFTGLGVQILRSPYWQFHDLAITSAFGTLTVTAIRDMIEQQKALKPIIKRAKNIKKASL